jgi:hypothetical protein
MIEEQIGASSCDEPKTLFCQNFFSDPVITRYRDTNANLRTQLERIIEKAGLSPWPKLFQNLRATRATEVADMPGIPSHVAADWLGHSTTIADKHYRQVTEEHFERALAQPAGNLRQPMQSGTETPRNDPQPKNEPLTISEDCEGLRYFAPCKVGDAGLEPATSTL